MRNLSIFLFASLLAATVESKVSTVAVGRIVDVKSLHRVSKTDATEDIVAAGAVSEGTSSVSSSIFNLAKTILGAGTLSLPSGIAGFSDSPSSLAPASALVIALGIISAYSFSSIGTACKTHGVTSYAAAWAKSTDRPKSAPVVTSLVTFKTFFACLAYSIIVGDSFSNIFRSLGATGALCERTNVVIGLTSLVIFPLCLLKNLDALKYTSILGLAGTIYCAGFMGLRLFDGSYAEGGKYFSAIAQNLRPSFGVKNNSPKDTAQGVFMFMSMIATAYMAHYNAPKFMTELKERTVSNYNKVTSAAFGFAILMYTFVLVIGFLTFGGNAQGFILNNYASTDSLATVARIAIGGGVLFGYPLTFTALRDGFLDIAGLDTNKYFVPATVGLLAIITQMSLVVTDVGSVLSFSGALIGSLLIFIIPAIMNICNIKREQKVAAEKGGESAKGSNTVVVLNYAMAVFGVMVAVIGVGANIAAGGKGGGH